MKLYRNELKIGGKKLNVVTINQEDGEVTQEVKKVAVPTVHHIHILDRSGSMSGSINQLIDQVQLTLDIISKDDLVSIIWFASHGEYKTLFKGAKPSKELKEKLNQLRSTLGCTCFSDPLQEAGEIVKDLRGLCDTVSITLFTDGCPVVPWSRDTEFEKCMAIIENFGDDVIAVNTVGYGNYYDQDFMKGLSSFSEYGIFTHSSRIEEYLSIFENNFERVAESKTESVSIKTYTHDVPCIYLNRKFSKMTDNGIQLRKLDKNKNQFFLFSERHFSFDYNDKEQCSASLREEANANTVANFMYAYAYNLYYQNKARESLEVLVALQDKFLIDSHMNAFTYDERAAHQKNLENAMLNTSDRYKEGKATKNYVPAKDAFCVFDLLNILATSDSFYVPFHSEAQDYQRIGKKTVDHKYQFVYGDEIVVSNMDELVYNKERCNLSIRFKVNGYVDFIDAAGAKAVGLPTKVDSYIYRNHSIIKDGTLNLKKIVVMMPENVFDSIMEKRKILEVVMFGNIGQHKEIEKMFGQKYVCCVVNLSKLPIINMQYNESIDVKDVFEAANELVCYEATQKVLNYYFKKFSEGATAAQKKVGAYEGKTAEQIKFLEANGIDKSGAYSGTDNVTAKKDECDSYTTRSFKFVFEGISSLPDVDKVMEAKSKGKKLTIAFQKIAEAKENVDSVAHADCIDLTASVVKTREWLNKHLKEVKGKLFSIRGRLAAIKMAKLLTGDNFNGFDVDKDNNYIYKAKDMTLIMKMDRVTEYF